MGLGDSLYQKQYVVKNQIFNLVALPRKGTVVLLGWDFQVMADNIIIMDILHNRMCLVLFHGITHDICIACFFSFFSTEKCDPKWKEKNNITSDSL